MHHHSPHHAHGPAKPVKRAAAALSVGVGSLTDPWDLQVGQSCLPNLAWPNRGAAQQRPLPYSTQQQLWELKPQANAKQTPALLLCCHLAGPEPLPGAHAVHGQRAVPG